MRGHSRIRGMVVLVAGIFVAACTASSLEVGSPLSLSLSSNTPVVVADSLVLEYEIAGRNLLGLIVDFGDLEMDSIALSGAQTAGGRRPHLYASPGQYTITARVEDGTQPAVTEQLLVTINP